MSTPRVVLTRHLPDAEKVLAAAGLSFERAETNRGTTRAQLLSKLPGIDALIPTFGDRVDGELLDAAGPTLRIAANYGVGYDNIDVAACRERNVRVSNTPGVLTDATADVAWLLILAACRRLTEGQKLVRGGEWTGPEPDQLLGIELAGATLGIVGAGRIGSAVARRAVAFKMKILYASPRPNPELERDTQAKHVPFDTLIADSDVISLHVPMRPENRHLIGREQFARMRPFAVLVNTARGPVVDEVALVEALRTQRIASAGLDVYENEPKLTPGLAELDNLVLLPHLGSATCRTRGRMAKMAAENVVAWLEGREPPNAVA